MKQDRETYESLGDTSREDIIADDMIISSADESGHDSVLRIVMLKEIKILNVTRIKQKEIEIKQTLDLACV